MKRNRSYFKNLHVLLTLTTLFCFGTLTRAQSTPAQNNKPTPDNMSVRDNDTTRTELAQFDKFLDSHPEIAEQLRKDPSLVNNKDFVDKHPALQTFLREQPGVREEIRENPNAFMRQENNFDRREDARDRDTTPKDRAEFDRFLDSHREIAEQLRKDPSLVNNKDFVDKHPALQTFLREQPGVREEIRENPNAFMREENGFDRRDDMRDRDTMSRDRDITPKDKAEFDRFLDSHREIAEQLRKDPSLVNNRDFVDKHPALQEYLQQQPGVREEIRENPNAFVRQDNDFDRQGDRRDRDTRSQSASFKEFLDGHGDISRQLSKDPSVAKNREFVESHPELQAYLKTHPDVQDELMKNPQSFVKSAQTGVNTNITTKPAAPTTSTSPSSTSTTSPSNNSREPVQAPKVDAKPMQ